MSETIYHTNEFQTPITKELLDSYPKEIGQELLELINSVEFIKRLVSPDRKRAKDLKRDEEGKIIVDVMNPHILENMDYFRPTAIHFEKYGVLTKLRPNNNPNSSYYKWMKEEVRRIWYGLVRESDGEWITGPMYFYLNYMPMKLTKAAEKGKRAANRITGLPRMWEGIYLWFHYLHQARYGGMYDNYEGGKHAIQVATRGASKSYSCASRLARLFVVGDNEETQKDVSGIIMAALKETLTKDGTLNKFEECIDFCAEYTQFPSQRLQSSINKMQWTMGYIDPQDNQTKRGTGNTIMGVTTNDDPEKGRGKRTTELIYEEIGVFPKFLDTWSVNEPSVQEGDSVWGQMIGIGCVCKGTKVYNKEGVLVNIEDINQDTGIIGFKDSKANVEHITYIQDEVYKECVEVITKDGTLRCSMDHPILVRSKYRPRINNNPNKRETIYYRDFKVPTKLRSADYISFIDRIDVYGEDTLFDAYMVGLLIGDGSYGHNSTPVLSNCDIDILNYVHSNYDTTIESRRETKDGREYQEIRIRQICDKLRSLGIYGQTKDKKRLPNNYKTLDYVNTINLIAGLYDSDGCLYIKGKDTAITLVQANKAILIQVEEVLRKLGILCNIYKVEPRENTIDRNPYYELRIRDKRSIYNFVDQIPLKVSYKKEKAKLLKEFSKVNDSMNQEAQYENIRLSRVLDVKPIGKQRVYNLTANDSNTYLANHMITHNTGGSEGSNFYGVMEMLYNPIGYQIYPLPNLYDKNTDGSGKTVFFFGAYLNREGYYNKDGVSDVVGTILNILERRHRVKYNSSDPTRLTRVVAERPLTIQEAIMRRDSSIFPVAQLNDRLLELDSNPNEYNDVYVGRMTIKDGEPEFVPSNHIPIRNFPHKDNKMDGAVEIYKMPEKNSDGQVFYGRYIAGTDPVDDDGETQTYSLQSTFVMDLWTDQIVAEYTGRPLMTEDYYEQIRLLFLFFKAECNYENNKKGLFGYFSKRNSLYLLSDTLEYLKDRDLIKGSKIGNQSKGFSATKGVNIEARRQYKEWLLELVSIEKKNDQGELEVVEVPRLYTLRQRALIQETIMWDNIGNFDRVSAIGALMLLREDRLIKGGGRTSSAEEQLSYKESYLGNDSFFTDNYDNRY